MQEQQLPPPPQREHLDHWLWCDFQLQPQSVTPGLWHQESARRGEAQTPGVPSKASGGRVDPKGRSGQQGPTGLGAVRLPLRHQLPWPAFTYPETSGLGPNPTTNGVTRVLSSPTSPRCPAVQSGGDASSACCTEQPGGFDEAEQEAVQALALWVGEGSSLQPGESPTRLLRRLSRNGVGPRWALDHEGDRCTQPMAEATSEWAMGPEG